MVGIRHSLFGSILISGVAAVVAGCGLLAPTPARNRPPLPEPQPMPGIAVEDVVPQLEVLGYECWFDRGSDIPSSWHCTGAAAVWLRSGMTGSLDVVSVSVQDEGAQAPDAQEFDVRATEAFAELVALLIPEEHRPTPDALFAGVQRNYPIELGSGWYLSFDRASSHRTLGIVYAEDPG